MNKSPIFSGSNELEELIKRVEKNLINQNPEIIQNQGVIRFATFSVGWIRKEITYWRKEDLVRELGELGISAKEACQVLCAAQEANGSEVSDKIYKALKAGQTESEYLKLYLTMLDSRNALELLKTVCGIDQAKQYWADQVKLTERFEPHRIA